MTKKTKNEPVPKQVLLLAEALEYEIDAYTLHHATGDFAFVVAVGSNIKHPDNFTDHLAKSKQFLLICHDNDEGGKAMMDKWRALYSHPKAHPAPKEKDIGEFIQLGENLH